LLTPKAKLGMLNTWSEICEAWDLSAISAMAIGSVACADLSAHS